jgi:hypothetical protein
MNPLMRVVRRIVPWLATLALAMSAAHAATPMPVPTPGRTATTTDTNTAKATAPSASAAAQAGTIHAVVRLDDPTRSLGDPITISIVNGPKGSFPARIELAREGRRYVLDAEYVEANNVGVVSAKALGATNDPAHPLTLGQYTVDVILDGVGYPLPASQHLEIVPYGNPALHLEKFETASTDVKTIATFATATPPGASASTVQRRIVALTLRGTGFQVGDFAAENGIYVNGLPVDVAWGDCSSQNQYQPFPVQETKGLAQAVSPQVLQLCHLPVDDHGGALLVKVRIGDRYSEEQRYFVYSMGTGPVAIAAGVIALLLALVPLAMLGAMSRAYRTSPGNEYKLRLLFLDPETDSYSLSKLQFYLWTVAALFGYSYLFISLVYVQGATWPDVPGSLPGIIFASGGTAIGAQIITSAKGSKGAGAVDPHITDFIMSGGVVAAERVQMLLWTLFGVGAFCVTAVHDVPGTIQTLPAIPPNLLALMGLSSVGYLGGKMARKPGPVINELSIEPSDTDGAVLAAGQPAATPADRPDLSVAIARANATLAAAGTATNAPATTALAQWTQAIQAASAARTDADLDALVQTLLQLRASVEDRATEAAAAYAGETDATRRAAAAANAGIAQQAAAALQDFGAAVTQAIAQAAAAPLQDADSPRFVRRVITIRGTSLSPDGLFMIDHAELPFRMLLDAQGRHQPDVVVRDDTAPTFAKLMTLTIDPEQLDTSDQNQVAAWFSAGGDHTFTLTNIDGQKAELKFTLPPGATQK